jgi:HK97 family phage portal protein
MTLPSVLQATEILCGVFAMTPLIYYQKTRSGPKKAEGSPLYSLFHDRPNDVQSPFLFKEVAMGDMLLAGRFASFVHRDRIFRPAMLSRLNPYPIQLSQSWSEADGAEHFYDVSLPDSSRRRLTRAECWFVPGFSRDGLNGFDRIALMATAIGGARATNEFAANFWANNARPDIALEVPGKVEKAAKEAIRRDWMSMYGGVNNAGGVAVLDQAMKATQLGGANKDAQFIEARQFGVLEVARAFGVPPHLLFELSRATFSNIEQQSLEFLIYSMGKHFERFASAATFYFAEPGHYFEFLPEALLKGDIKSRYEAYAIAIDKGVMNPNAVRRRENLPERDGGDAYRMGSGSQLEGQANVPAPVHAPTGA